MRFLAEPLVLDEPFGGSRRGPRKCLIPNVATIRLAYASPIPLTIPDPRYFSMPDEGVGRELGHAGCPGAARRARSSTSCRGPGRARPGRAAGTARRPRAAPRARPPPPSRRGSSCWRSQRHPLDLPFDDDFASFAAPTLRRPPHGSAKGLPFRPPALYHMRPARSCSLLAYALLSFGSLFSIVDPFTARADLPRAEGGQSYRAGQARTAPRGTLTCFSC